MTRFRATLAMAVVFCIVFADGFSSEAQAGGRLRQLFRRGQANNYSCCVAPECRRPCCEITPVFSPHAADEPDEPKTGGFYGYVYPWPGDPQLRPIGTDSDEDELVYCLKQQGYQALGYEIPESWVHVYSTSSPINECVYSTYGEPLKAVRIAYTYRCFKGVFGRRPCCFCHCRTEYVPCDWPAELVEQFVKEVGVVIADDVARQHGCCSRACLVRYCYQVDKCQDSP